MPAHPDDFLWLAVRKWVAARYPHHTLAALSIELDRGRPIFLPAPEPGEMLAQTPFSTNEMQDAILEALFGKALKADDLAAAAGYDRRTLYRKPGGLADLEAAGLVAKGSDGYFRPDCPPEG